MNSWGFPALIEIKNVNPEDTKGLWDFHQLGLQRSWLQRLTFPHGMTLDIS